MQVSKNRYRWIIHNKSIQIPWWRTEKKILHKRQTHKIIPTRFPPLPLTLETFSLCLIERHLQQQQNITKKLLHNSKQLKMGINKPHKRVILLERVKNNIPQMSQLSTSHLQIMIIHLIFYIHISNRIWICIARCFEQNRNGTLATFSLSRILIPFHLSSVEARGIGLRIRLLIGLVLHCNGLLFCRILTLIE